MRIRVEGKMPTWILRKSFSFAAAHRLPEHAGKCSRLHGHEWVGTLVLEGDQLQADGPALGMLVDFGDIKSAVDATIGEMFDHRYLNDVLPNPTCEELSRWIFDALKPHLPQLTAVELHETPTSSCEYRG